MLLIEAFISKLSDSFSIVDSNQQIPKLANGSLSMIKTKKNASNAKSTFIFAKNVKN